MGWDAGFLLYIQEYIRSDFLNPIMKVLTHSGDKGILLVTLIVILLIIKKTRPIGFMAAVSIAIEALLNNVLLKNIIARTRPYDEIDGLINLVGRQSDYSFPSGHTIRYWTAALVLTAIAPEHQNEILKVGYEGGESRTIVGFHYKSDVDAAMLAASAAFARLTADPLWQKLLKRSQREYSRKQAGR